MSHPAIPSFDDHARMLQLPGELLLMVSQSLSRKDLKNLRLVCKHVTGSATEQLFASVLISFWDEDIENIVAIAETPGLAIHVREVTWYDGIVRYPFRDDGVAEEGLSLGTSEERMMEVLQNDNTPARLYHSYCSKCDLNGHSPRDCRLSLSGTSEISSIRKMDYNRAAARLLRAENAVVGAGSEIDIFAACVKRFVGLQAVTISQDRRLHPIVREGYEFPQSLEKRCQRSFMSRSRKLQAVHFRAFSALLRVLQETDTQLKSFRYVPNVQYKGQGLSISLFNTRAQEGFHDGLHQMFSNLQSLELAFSHDTAKSGLSAPYESDGLLTLYNALNGAKHLRSLSLRFHPLLQKYACFSELLDNIRWQYFKKLDLEGMHCEYGDTLSKFLIEHRATLRSLRLFNFRLGGEWQPVVDAVRDAGCNLTSFSFRYLEWLPAGFDDRAEQHGFEISDGSEFLTASTVPPRYAFNYRYPNLVLSYMRGECDSPWPCPEEAHESLKYADDFYYRCYGDWDENNVDDWESEWKAVHDEKYDWVEAEGTLPEYDEDYDFYMEALRRTLENHEECVADDKGEGIGDGEGDYSAYDSNYESNFDSDFDSGNNDDDESNNHGDDVGNDEALLP